MLRNEDSRVVRLHLRLMCPAERCLYFDKHPQLVASLEQRLVGRIMGGADIIHVPFLEEFHIFPPDISRQGAPAQGHHLVPAYAAQLYRSVIDKNLVATYLNLSETNFPHRRI